MATDEQLRECLIYCYILIGLREYPTLDEDMVMFDYMRSNYARFTLQEVKKAFQMLIKDDLEAGKEHYGLFSAKYFSEVMEAYREEAVHLRKETGIGKWALGPQKQIETTGEVDWSPEWEKLLESARNGSLNQLYCVAAIYDWLKKRGMITFNALERNDIFEECRHAYAYELMVALRTANAPDMRAKYELLIKDGREWRENADLFNHVIMISKQETLKRQAYLTVKNEVNEI